MSAETAQVLHCLEGNHEWSRPMANGRPPASCSKHATPSKSHQSWTPEERLVYNHQGSDVPAGEVVQWARSLGFDIHPRLKGKVADILVARYNREHPDRPYVRVGGAA